MNYKGYLALHVWESSKDGEGDGMICDKLQSRASHGDRETQRETSVTLAGAMVEIRNGCLPNTGEAICPSVLFLGSLIKLYQMIVQFEIKL